MDFPFDDDEVQKLLPFVRSRKGNLTTLDGSPLNRTSTPRNTTCAFCGPKRSFEASEPGDETLAELPNTPERTFIEEDSISDATKEFLREQLNFLETQKKFISELHSTAGEFCVLVQDLHDRNNAMIKSVRDKLKKY
ncbi:hypothetical protein CJU89_6600 [Yarrowia sp. B02]|nr:hypothetical protein CJU89_6600 [Yarrowia sp. B02]